MTVAFGCDIAYNDYDNIQYLWTTFDSCGRLNFCHTPTFDETETIYKSN